jgi:hypothetical protein
MSIAEAEIHTGSIESALKRIKTIENMIKETKVPVVKSKFGSFDSTALMARVRMLDAQLALSLLNAGIWIGTANTSSLPRMR